MKTLELICWAKERHQHYCWLATKFLGNFDKVFEYPKFSLFASKSRIAGLAKYGNGKKTCDYNLSFLLAVKENYEQTIAHEVAHFTLPYLKVDAKSHGELFMFILHNVFHGRATKYHEYPREEKHIVQAIALMKIVKLNEVVLKDVAEKAKS